MPWNFKQRSETIRRYGASALPVGSTLTDWPLDYAELEPYYEKVEFLLGVSGKAGNISGTIDPRGNVFEGLRRREYPLPPLRRTGFTEFMADAARRLGWHPSRGRLRSGRRSTTACAPASTTASAPGAAVTSMRRARPAWTSIPLAEKTRNLDIVEHARSSRSRWTSRPRERVPLPQGRPPALPAGEGRPARGIHVREHTASPALEVEGLPERPLEQPRPGGPPLPGTRSCRRERRHPGRKLNRFSGTASQWTAVDDFDSDFFDHTGLGFTGGGTMSATMEAKPIGAARTTRLAAALGLMEGVAEAERDLGRLHRHAGERRAVRGHLPRPRPGDEGPRTGSRSSASPTT